ncbi:MAG: hypothetical protein GX111_02060 [Clostridiales bacterium]|nr:hypothetical protein [Clostridiales bacterium]
MATHPQPAIFPVDAYEHYETEYIDDMGFRVFAKRPKPDYTPVPDPPPSDPARFSAEKFALEAASGGKNTLLFDDLGLPSVMVRIPMFLWSDVLEGAPEEPCSAFVIDGKVHESIYISKYLNVIEHGRGYSLPGRNPASMYTRDEMKAACARKGKGWHLMSNAEYMALAFWCRKNNHFPHGNSNSGSDFFHRHEHGVRRYMGWFKGAHFDMHMWPTLTGTGPDTWSHDGTPFGIFDLIGNLWDTLSGLRLMNGEIQVIPDNNSALNVDEGPDSTYWRAILADGSFALPGTPGTYKIDSLILGRENEDFVNIGSVGCLSTEITKPLYTGSSPDLTHRAYTVFPFAEMTHTDIAKPNMRLKQLGIYPVENMQREPVFFLRNYGERMLCKGGSWFDGKTASMWELYMREERGWIAQDIGFRCAYAEI